MFRFSLKWILAAMVYAAIAAAAFSQQTWVYADLLCGAALLALGYALLLVIYTRGPRQAAAAGFAVCMILIAAVVQISPDSVPTLRILTATGIGQPPILPTGGGHILNRHVEPHSRLDRYDKLLRVAERTFRMAECSKL
jgi:hypothetical protein